MAMDMDHHHRVLKHYHSAFKDGVERVQSHLQDLIDQAEDGDLISIEDLEDLHAQIASLKQISPENPVAPIPHADPPQYLKNQGRPATEGSLRMPAPEGVYEAPSEPLPEQMGSETPQGKETRPGVRSRQPGGRRR